MEKTSITPDNTFCPQALFLYGTYKEDGSANFGEFCWFSYCWDGELAVMACIGGSKLTLERIEKTKVFSANLVTRPLLPLADYLGNNDAYSTPGKMDIPIQIERGMALPVPTLKDSPWVFELEVGHRIPLDDSVVFLCKIRNVLAAKELMDASMSIQERTRMIEPVVWMGAGPYFPIDPAPIGSAGDWKDLYPQKTS